MMNSFVSATVNLTSSRCCFVKLSADLAHRLPTSSQGPGKVVIFQAEWSSGVAFVSWSGEVTVNRSVGFDQTKSSVIEVGRKFAELNGIQHGEQVVLMPMDRTITPLCTRIYVDPFSADDWEILELHAGFIETNLLNQVRVVWSGQAVPIWINKNTCIVIKIGQTEPSAPCVILDEFTEVIVSPKQRTFSSTKKSELLNSPLKKEKQKISQQSEEKDCSKHQENFRERTLIQNDGLKFCKSNEAETITSKAYNWWNYLLHGEPEDNHEVSQGKFTSTNRNQNIIVENDHVEIGVVENMKRNCCISAFEKVELELCLRSQMEMKSLQTLSQEEECNRKTDVYSLQQFTVFVHPNTIGFSKLKCGKNHSVVYPEEFEGLTKIIKIQKVLSPRERLELFNVRKGKSDKGNETSQASPANQTKKDGVTKQEKTFNKAVIKMVLNKDVIPGHIAIHSLLQKQLGSIVISQFLISHVSHEPQEVQGIVLHPVRSTVIKIEELGHERVLGSFHDWVSKTSSASCPLVLWNGATVTYDCHGNSVEFIVSVLSHAQSMDNGENIPYYNITAGTLDGIKVVLGDVIPTSKAAIEMIHLQQSLNKIQPCCSIEDLGGFNEPFHKCMSHLLVCLGKQPLTTLLSGGLTSGLGNGAVLICGSGAHVGEGCGKTSLAHALCHEIQRWPICGHVTIIDCIPLRAKRVETIQSQWQQAFTEASWHQPSVILLDNLDHVISAPNVTQEMGGEGFYRKRLVEVFKDLIATEVTNNSAIAVIATSRSHDSLHAALWSGRGSRVFQCSVELGALNENQRMEVLSKMIKKKFKDLNEIELETLLKSVAKRSEGFSPKDLSSLTDRAVHFSVMRKINKTKESNQLSSLVPDDFIQASSGFTPASLRDVQLHKAGDLSWSDVGGLSEVKETLKETLLWPSKYRKVFSKCPLRVRSGLLLYGPPGTGKTLLAGVVANESGLNFISIKGPELLSKFIGASEQSVRDIFTRAQAAKPCILFFDEFDSLAPRRGHDSTGVTDRVVNQLLTQLDGVEGLEGVYILAATSRPGLIDPALLRPGRLDKCVYCPIPNKGERLEILQALTRSLPLADNVDLKSIADKCEYFTGADLKALLYNAQLESIHRSTSKLKLYGNIFNTNDGIKEEPDKLREDQIEMELSQTQERVLAFSIGEGKSVLSREEKEAIENEVAVLQENHQSFPLHSTTQVEKRKFDTKENVISISQSDLDKAASSLKPSVSPKERLVYENIYDSFVKSRGGSFTKNLPVEGKATLA